MGGREGHVGGTVAEAREKAIAFGIGIGSGYLFETTSEKEVLSDLVGERGVLMGALAGMIEAQFEILRKNGHSPSEAFNETVEELTQSLVRLVDENGMALALRWACSQANELIDPHTAIGLAAAREADLPADVPVVTLATAHPAKFPDAVERASGLRPSMPARAQGLFDREERYATLPAELGAVEAYIAERAVAA